MLICVSPTCPVAAKQKTVILVIWSSVENSWNVLDILGPSYENISLRSPELLLKLLGKGLYKLTQPTLFKSIALSVLNFSLEVQSYRSPIKPEC